MVRKRQASTRHGSSTKRGSNRTSAGDSSGPSGNASQQASDVHKATTRWRKVAAALVLIVLVVLVAIVAFPPGRGDSVTTSGFESAAQYSTPTDPPQRNTNSNKKAAAELNQAGQNEPLDLPTTQADVDVASEQKQILDALESAIERFPQDSQLLVTAALTYSDLRNTERAIELFKRALTHAENQVEILVPLSDLLLQLGDQKQLIEYVAPAATSPLATPELLTSLGRAHAELGQGNEAVDVLTAAKRQFPNSSAVAAELAQAQLIVQNYESAEEEARRAIELGRDDREILLTLSNALLKQGKRDEAIQIRQKLPSAVVNTKLDDADYENLFREFAAHTYSLLASRLDSHGLTKESEQCLLNALNIEPESTKLLVPLADSFFRRQDLESTLAVRQRLTAVEPDNPVHYRNLASIALALQQNTVAEQALVTGAEVDDTGISDVVLCQFYLGAGKYAQAATAAKRSVDRLGTADCYIALVTSLNMNGESAQALIALLKAKELFPEDPRISQLTL